MNKAEIYVGVVVTTNIPGEWQVIELGDENFFYAIQIELDQTEKIIMHKFEIPGTLYYDDIVSILGILKENL